MCLFDFGTSSRASRRQRRFWSTNDIHGEMSTRHGIKTLMFHFLLLCHRFFAHKFSFHFISLDSIAAAPCLNM